MVELEGVDTMNDAETLRGVELRVPEEALQPLPEGTLLRAPAGRLRRRRPSTGVRVGTVRAVEGGGGTSRAGRGRGARGDSGAAGRTRSASTIDVAGKRIVIDPPEGLLDVNRRST